MAFLNQQPMMMNVTRDIYEAFWRKGQMPLTRTIRVANIYHGGKAEVWAMSCDIPEKMLEEYTIESLQKILDGRAQELWKRIALN